MEIHLGTYTGKSNVYLKNVTFDIINGTLKERVTVQDPTITVERKTKSIKYNYAYIPEFNRYYFITACTINSAKTVEYKMHCDVLSSFALAYASSKILVERSSNVASNSEKNFLNDGLRDVSCKREKRTIDFPLGFTPNGKFILMTNGGN